MKHLTLGLAAAALIAASGPAAAQDDLLGVWRNPKNSVHVDIRPCGPSACGVVIWASQKAREDARRGSGRELIGMKLFQDFTRASDEWRGKVFVPDLNRTLAGAARVVDDNHLEAKGCALGFFCKTQVWTRVTQSTS
ncbi:MAG TPA: DUF2147 domain-containing protein [Phenylobacterium sp.]|uniref:DUF2147 domain-containing protein n=1 Tax=Phenylobacterium sp. TaxID=1871053 RepID=UPI002B4950D0|nr:DUF2147 domain-containing protein [Phenylobacterium sp.]HKR86969.1 DUF2147 domain-containing protein [Phenylobacterium sp.]